ncbi:MAG: HAMP domain-containing protein [Candidatus Omnitrophica bacterium]|nr:HAMP domain-containing protein [Candidatus Omnitrophota bacterium]
MRSRRSSLRRQQLIDPAYQLRLVTRLFLVILAIASTSSLLSSVLLWRHMYVPDQGVQITLVVSLIAVAATLLIELLLAIPITFYVIVRQSHRIIGPMNRIKRTLETIGTGDFSQRITVRRDDVLQELVQVINRMAENLQRRFPRPPAS